MEERRKGLFLLIGFLFSKCVESGPIIDPGVFVIQGVASCRQGKGYCILGRRCTIDRDFVEDDKNGSCGQLAKSFSSQLDFTCCKYVNETVEEEYFTTMSTFTEVDEKFQILDENPIPIPNPDDQEIPEDEDPSNLVNIVGIVTDMTGIISLVTQPYQSPTTSKPTTTTKEPEILGENFLANEDSAAEYPTEEDQNDVMVMSLPEEIRKFLREKQPESIPQSNNSRENQQTTSNVNDLEGFERGVTTEVTYDFTSQISNAVEKSIATKQSNLKRNPLIPLNSNQKKGPATFNSSKLQKLQRNDFTNHQTTVPNLPTLISNYSDSTSRTYTSVDPQSSTWRENGFDEVSSSPSHFQSFSPRTETPTLPNTFLKPYTNSLLRNKSFSNVNEVTTGFPTTLLKTMPTLRSTLLQKFKDVDQKFSQLKGKENLNTYHAQRLHSVNLNECGIRRSNLQISNGLVTASTYDWCWSAAVMSKEGEGARFECTGTLVEYNLVMTTAACVKRLNQKDLVMYRVVLGDSNLRDGLPYGVQYHDIQEILAHPDYLTSGATHSNDIGLIRLRDMATIDHNVCLACVPHPKAVVPNEACVATGYTFGELPDQIRRDVELDFPMEGVLRETAVKLEQSTKCHSWIKEMADSPLIAATPDAFLCDVQNKFARSCDRTFDGGSPLVCKVEGRWFLTGISSWSRDCTSKPNVYTKVSSFVDWYLHSRLRMYAFIMYAH